MIRLIEVSKYYMTDFGRHYVFQDVTLDLPPDKSVGIIGPNGAGKSTFLRLIAGADIPSSGTILRTGKISPPMGLTPGLQASLNGTENARFAGRIYGMNRDDINDMTEYVRELANIGKYFDMPVSTYSAGMKQRVSFAINMSMQFDYYLFDEISAGGDREFRKIAKALVQERLQTSKFLMTSHNTKELLEICQAGIVIQNGELTYFDDINEAAAFYGDDDESEKPNRRRRRRRDETGETDEPVGDSLRAGPDEADTPETREARRERRRLLVEDRRRRKVEEDGTGPIAGENAEALNQVSTDIPNSDPSQNSVEVRNARLAASEERRRQRRELREHDAAAESASVPVDVDREAELEAATDAEDEAIRIRLANIEERRRLRRQERAARLDDAAPVLEIRQEGESAAVAGIKEERKVRLALAEDRRRLRREEQEGETAATAVEAEAPEVADPDGEERRTRLATAQERRQQRREQREREVAAALLEEPIEEAEQSSVAEEEPAEVMPDVDVNERRRSRRARGRRASNESIPVIEVVEATAAVVIESADGAEKTTRLASAAEKRRLRREALKLQRMDVSVVVVFPPSGETPPKSREVIRAERLLARQQRRGSQEQPDLLPKEPAAAVAFPDSVAPQPMAQMSAESQPVEATPLITPIAERTPLRGLARLTRLIEERKGPLTPTFDIASTQSVSASHLIRRTVLRQERAHLKSARAARMLINHLAAATDVEGMLSEARAMLVAATQETAASEAAEARRLLDEVLMPISAEGKVRPRADLDPELPAAIGQVANSSASKDR